MRGAAVAVFSFAMDRSIVELKDYALTHFALIDDQATEKTGHRKPPAE